MKKIDVVVKFFYSIFSIVYAFSSQVQVVKYDSFIFQYHRPIDFVITIYDPGSDSRTNPFQERENDMIQGTTFDMNAATQGDKKLTWVGNQANPHASFSKPQEL